MTKEKCKNCGEEKAFHPNQDLLTNKECKKFEPENNSSSSSYFSEKNRDTNKPEVGDERVPVKSSGTSSLSDKITKKGNITSENVRECIIDIKEEFMRRFYGSNITTKEYEEFLDFINKRAGEELI